MEHHILWSRCPECTIQRCLLLHAIIVKISNLNFLRSPKPPFMPQDPLVKIFTKLAKNPPLCWESQKIQKVKYYDNFRFKKKNLWKFTTNSYKNYSILGALTLVGNLELIDEPLTAFVRLEEGILMPNALEIPIPVRFIFLLLTPKSDLTIGMMM